MSISEETRPRWSLHSRISPAERFWARVRKTEECWVWTGSLNVAGYGMLRVNGRDTPAHRFSWVLHHGVPIPAETLDHLCSNRMCVRPDHLEPVSRGENSRRAMKKITHCPQGHPYDANNTHHRKRGSRDCRACMRERERVKRAAKKAATNGNA